MFDTSVVIIQSSRVAAIPWREWDKHHIDTLLQQVPSEAQCVFLAGLINPPDLTNCPAPVLWKSLDGRSGYVWGIFHQCIVKDTTIQNIIKLYRITDGVPRIIKLCAKCRLNLVGCQCRERDHYCTDCISKLPSCSIL